MIDHQHGIDNEPQFSASHTKCTELLRDEPALNGLANNSENEQAEFSVLDEPVFENVNLDISAMSYGQWLEKKQSDTGLLKTTLITLCISISAGIFAVIGALTMSLQGRGGFGILALVLFAPMIEELLKIAPILMTVERRPYLIRWPWQIVFCGFIGGLFFSIIENIIYLNIYIEEPGKFITDWRWSVCVALHTGCSLIASLGVVRMWRHSKASLQKPQVLTAKKMIVVAMIIHGCYNLLATLFNDFLSNS